MLRDAPEDKRISAGRVHNFQMENRQRAVITGVEDVDSFNEQLVVLVTSAGEMTLVGENLHIEKLNLEDGQLIVDGQIQALEYTDKMPGRKSGLFKRFFR